MDESVIKMSVSYNVMRRIDPKRCIKKSSNWHSGYPENNTMFVVRCESDGHDPIIIPAIFDCKDDKPNDLCWTFCVGGIFDTPDWIDGNANKLKVIEWIDFDIPTDDLIEDGTFVLKHE